MQQNFKLDFFELLAKLKSKEPFAFSKYADGEYAILRNQAITNCDNWTFDPTIVKHQVFRDYLLDSYTSKEENYYVGISCSCCQPQDHVQWMKDNTGVPKERLTFANIFVNSNYELYKQYFIEEYKKRDIVLVANKNATIEKLPFKVNHYHIYDSPFDNDILFNTSRLEGYKNKLFLFAAGPFGNVMINELWSFNKNNTYLDIGSTLNPWLVGNNRGYLKSPSNKTCIW